MAVGQSTSLAQLRYALATNGLDVAVNPKPQQQSWKSNLETLMDTTSGRYWGSVARVHPPPFDTLGNIGCLLIWALVLYAVFK